MRRSIAATFAALLLLLAAACSSDDGGTDDATSPDAAVDADGSTDEGGAADGADDEDGADDGGADAGDEDEAAPSGGGQGAGTATVTLDNGDTFEFSTLCNLEPQIAAGSEILFTIVSYDDPYNLDVTQFGEDAFGGEGTISIYDSTSYDTIWEAGSFGSEATLTLDGSTVTGSGTFMAAGEPGGETVGGELLAEC